MKALFPVIALIAAAFPAYGQDANEMIRRVRLSAALQKTDLNGVIRKEGGSKTPVSLFLREQNMQFLLGPNHAADRFHIRMGDEKCVLLEVGPDGKTQAFPAAKLVAPIAATDLTYEDLTLRFLYWPNAILEGTEKIGGEECWRVRLDNPGREGAFGLVYVWVHKKYGAFWTIRAHNRKGELIKEFQVKSVMKVPGGGYTLEQMQISTKDGKGRNASLTILEFNKATAPQPLK